MYRDEEFDIDEEYEDLRKSKCFKPYMTSPYHSMPCPMPCPMPYPMQMPMMQEPAMQMPMMQEPYQASGQCPVCGKSKKCGNYRDINLEEDDDRAQYSKPYYHHNSKPYYHHNYNPYYHPYYKPYHHYYKPYYKPYHSYGPGYMNRDFEE